MTAPGDRPRFAIVTPVYDVAPYLPAFIESVEHLRIASRDLQVVAVDDGSTDGSLALLHEWAARSRYAVEVVTKPNGGQASARNLGLDLVTAEWVTFPDPDDLLRPDYLAAAAGFADAHPRVELLSARPVLLREAKGGRAVPHPRDWQYRGGSRTADLLVEPNVFLGVCAGSFFRLDRIAASQLRFDERIRPNFEDAHFAVRYLLDLPRPVIGLVREAVYVYRKRADGSSTLQASMRHPGRYSTVLDLGYLDVIERARLPNGSVPPWIQDLLIYELSWYLAEEDKVSTGAFLEPAQAPRFHELLGRILRQLDPQVVAQHRVARLGPLLLDVFAHAAKPGAWHAPAVVTDGWDREMGLRRIAYRFSGPPPEEQLTIDGVPVAPAFAKTMGHRFYGGDLLWSRLIWLPLAGRLRVALNGEPVPEQQRWPRHRPGQEGASRLELLRQGIARLRAQSLAEVARPAWARLRRSARSARGLALRRLADSGLGAPYRDAWLLMDRIHDADDNGERLFEHIRRERPDINAWFVLERGTPDWDRLAAAGTDRLLAHGSLRWKLAMLRCRWLLSSHIDMPIYRPPQLGGTGSPSWKVAFLQHGIIKDDLSVWLNKREIELFVVSTEAERASVADDGTAYRFTAKETRNAGLPRFDRLLAKGRAVAEADRNLVIVAPTWRAWLARPVTSGRTSQRRTHEDGSWDSAYLRNWLGILRSEAIAAAIAARGWRLGFMPHPNLQSMLPALDLPAGVERLAFAGTDVQELYARCALLVTDYSSVVFNTAYLDRPAVYFQFDRAEVLGGAHVGRLGYFDYGRDGFGPVASDLDSAERAIIEAIRHGPRPTPEFQRRIDATFPVRDGRACARVVAAVEERSRPWSGLVEARPERPAALVEASG